MAGAFQTSRDIFENPIWQNIVEFRLFFLIYGKATFIDGVKVGDTTLNRGQWIRSVRNLQLDLEFKENRAVKRYSTATIYRAIKNLIKSERIKIEVSELGTLFEVVNYAKYQGLENYKNTIGNAEETATKQQRNNNKNGNKGKKINKDIIYTKIFEIFFSLYPNQFNKEQSFKNWTNLLKTESIENIMRATENYIQYCKDSETVMPFIVRSTNFIGQHKEYKGYLDYVAGTAKPKPKQVDKKPDYANFKQREHSDEYFDSLYKNTTK